MIYLHFLFCNYVIICLFPNPIVIEIFQHETIEITLIYDHVHREGSE